MRNLTHYREGQSPISAGPASQPPPTDNRESLSARTLREIADLAAGWLMVIVAILFVLQVLYGGGHG